MTLKGGKITENIEKHLNACRVIGVELFIDETKINITAENQINIQTVLEDMRLRDTTDLCEELELGDITSTIDFNVDQLTAEKTSTYQNNYLSPIAKDYVDIFDTHTSNTIARYLCVSAPANEIIRFISKPNLIHGKVPMILEVKSRLDVNKSSVVGIENLNLNSNLESDITLIELDLFQQCLERVLEQIEFRAYLSKFVVLGSTGHVSWCFYYTQNFEHKYNKKLHVIKISNADINTVWNGMSDAVNVKGDSFYLGKHAPILGKTLQTLFPRDDLHSIQVTVAGISTSVVYYVTPLDIGGNQISPQYKFNPYAIKVVPDVVLFTREIDKLERIKTEWCKVIFNQYFYYLSNSRNMTLLDSNKKPYTWFIASQNVGNNGCEAIVMRPALKTKLSDVRDTNMNREIFSELFRSLTIAHRAGILHCDLSPNNCMQFGDGWQVIDYGLSVDIDCKEGWMSDYSGRVTIQKNSFQHQCCGYRAYEIVAGNDYDEYVTDIDWTIGDDIEMLHHACCRRK